MRGLGPMADGDRFCAGNSATDVDGAGFAGNTVPYQGDEDFRQRIIDTLHEVYDPEVGLSIVDVGLVYRVLVEAGRVDIRVTMTSAACPLSDQIIDDIVFQLEQVLPEDWNVAVELCWDPPWTPDRISERGRRQMGW